MNKVARRVFCAFGGHRLEPFRLFAPALLALTVVGPGTATAQTTTWHFHAEASELEPTYRQLTEAGPDAAATTIQSVNLRKLSARQNVQIATFQSQFDAATVGVLPAGSVVTFTLWMRATAAEGVQHPFIEVSRTWADTPKMVFCRAGAPLTPTPPPLTTTFTPYTLSCTTTQEISFESWDRLVVRVYAYIATVSTKHVYAELNVEGLVNGQYDSRMTLPTLTPPASIASIAPARRMTR